METISINNIGKIDATRYSVEERDFISYILKKDHNVQEDSRKDAQSKEKASSWKVILKEEEFANWIQNCNCFYLSFDRASKSNIGTAGVRGIIMNSNGECILHYEWGLGKVSNNRVEALALFQGLTQLGKLGINKAKVFGDSSIVIHLMVHQQDSPNTLLQQINRRNQILHQTMDDIQYYHILHNLNKRDDGCTNSACGRPVGTLIYNSKETYQPLP